LYFSVHRAFTGDVTIAVQLVIQLRLAKRLFLLVSQPDPVVPLPYAARQNRDGSGSYPRFVVFYRDFDRSGFAQRIAVNVIRGGVSRFFLYSKIFLSTRSMISSTA
jgi:hypothetical protein